MLYGKPDWFRILLLKATFEMNHKSAKKQVEKNSATLENERSVWFEHG